MRGDGMQLRRRYSFPLVALNPMFPPRTFLDNIFPVIREFLTERTA